MRAMGAAVFGAAALLMAPGEVLADAIDGDWCQTNGKRLSIRGPRIVTPGGTSMIGDYDRHGFAYIVPRGEAGAGKTMVMILLDEDTMEMGEGPSRRAPRKPEIWRRCSAPVS